MLQTAVNVSDIKIAGYRESVNGRTDRRYRSGPILAVSMTQSQAILRAVNASSPISGVVICPLLVPDTTYCNGIATTVP